jgi:hypothetical protein
VDFIDATLIRIADPATRASVFDQPTLEQMVAAAYDTSSLALREPYSPIFDRFELGLSVSAVGMLEGMFRMPGATPSGDIQLQISGLGPLLPMRGDALWVGSIVARTVPLNSRIGSVRARFTLDDIDAAIRKDLGALPADPAALETERRRRFLAAMRGAMNQPELLTEPAFDDWLAGVGATSVGDLIVNHRDQIASGVMQIGFSQDIDQAPSPAPLPIAAAILIRDINVSVAQLLMESKMLREQLTDRGIAIPSNSALPARNPFLVVWLVPIAMFDDAAWPGVGADPEALRADRRRKAAIWLAPEGIVVAGVPQ